MEKDFKLKKGILSLLAHQTGIHKVTISRYLHGERLPGPERAVKLEHVTGIQACFWMCRPDMLIDKLNKKYKEKEKETCPNTKRL